MEKTVLQLENKVKELKLWKENISRERLTYPIDLASRRILDDNLLVFTGRIIENIDYLSLLTDTFISIDAQVFTDTSDDVTGVQLKTIRLSLELCLFTADYLTNIFTDGNGAHNLQNGDIIALTTTDVLPSGVSPLTNYYIISRTNSTFKLSTTLNGSEIDITDNGSGTHYYVKP